MTRREMIDTQTSCFVIVENAIILLSTTVLKSAEVGGSKSEMLHSEQRHA